MVRTIAAWYALFAGVVICMLPFRWLGLSLLDPDAAGFYAVAFVAAGLMLVGGGIARIMRLPGRNAAVFYGFGAGTVALGMAAARLCEIGAPTYQTLVLAVLAVLLVIASWSLWPSGA